MHLTIRINATSERLGGVMEEGSPAHRESWRRLTDDAKSVLPKIFLPTEPRPLIGLRFGEQGFELRDGHAQESSLTKYLEAMIRIVTNQQAVELRKNPFSANAREALGL